MARALACTAVLLLAVLALCSAQQQTLIQLVNAIPGSSSLDLFEDGVALNSGVRYLNQPDPLYVASNVGSGMVEYELRSGGVVLVTETFLISPGKQYTILATGRTDVNFQTELHIIEDTEWNNCPVPDGTSRYRFCHGAPGISQADLIDADSNVLYALDVTLYQCSDFFFLPSRTVSFQVIQSSIPSADPTEVLPSAVTFESVNHAVYTFWLVGVVTEPQTPPTLHEVSHIPCAQPVPFQMTPLQKPPPVNDILKILDSDRRNPFGQPIVMSDGIATVQQPEEYYVNFVFPPPLSPLNNDAAVALRPLVSAVLLAVFSVYMLW